MQDTLRRKIGISLIVLAVFGFFYFRREKLSDHYLDRAEKARIAGDEEEALRNFVLGAALKEKRGSGEVAVERAEIFLGRGDFVPAEKLLLRALEEDGTSAQVYGLLGRIGSARGEYARAEEYYALAATEGGNATIIALERAKNLVRAGEFFEAENMLFAAVEDSSDEDAIYYLGLVRANAGRFSPADFAALRGGEYEDDIALVEDYFTSEDSDVATDVSLVACADLFRRLGEGELALADLEIVLARNGKYRDAYLVSGKTYLALGDRSAAGDAFQKALALDGDNKEAIFYLSRIYEGTEKE